MIAGLRRYRVRAVARQPLIDFMLDALRMSGCTILFTSPADEAPFVTTFETATGERIGIVAYAFLATRTETKNRPPDERSFQLKYGNKADYHAANLHELWQDPLGLFTTLLIGIDPKEGFFLGADPEMHNPTKLFIRMEFKDRHAEQIKARRWFAWEREHRGNKVMAEPVEVLVGGTAESFLSYVQFERAAKGLDQGNRQLLAEKPEGFSVPTKLTDVAIDQQMAAVGSHPLLSELALSSDQILEIIANASRLKMAVRGWVAEDHLRRHLLTVAGVTECERMGGDRTADLRLRFRGGPPLSIECKNVLRVPNKLGEPRVDFQRTRASKADPCSRYYAPGDADIVAACLHAVTEAWEFRYVLSLSLPKHEKCPGKIRSNLSVGPAWLNDPTFIFEAASAQAA